MGYRIEIDETFPEAVRRIAVEQIDKARDEIGSCEQRTAIHQVRKRCKKLRGLLRLVRLEMEEVYDAENAHFRDLARELSELRDATSLLECFDRLTERLGDELAPADPAEVRASLEERRAKLEAAQRPEPRLEQADASLREARSRVSDWRFDADGARAFARSAEKTYGRARDAMRLARKEPTGENLHDWRKRVKYHRYHVRLLVNAWRPVAPAFRESAKTLSDQLGDHHDLVVLRARLVSEGDHFGPPRRLEALLGAIDLRRLELRTAAMPLGARLFAEPPKRWRKRWKRYWRAGEHERHLERSLPRAG